MPQVLEVIEVLKEMPKSRVYRVRMEPMMDGEVLPFQGTMYRDVFVPNSLAEFDGGKVLKVRTWFFKKALAKMQEKIGILESRFAAPYVPPPVGAEEAIVL